MRSQMLRPAQILELQQRHLSRMVSFAHATLAFYRARLAPVMGSARGFDFSRWHEVPILDRATVHAHLAELEPPAVPPFAGPTGEKPTSGSSGLVLRLKRSDLLARFDIALTQRAYSWWRLDPRATQVAIMTLANDPALLDPQGRRDWHFADPAGRAYALQASATPQRQAQFLRERNPDYLVTQPTMGEALADQVIDSGVALGLKAVLTVGESLHPEQRALFNRAFGARTYDTYGCIEVGHVAAECPVCGCYHVNAESVLLEVVDDRGRPVAPGETGRAVLTSLHNFAMPLIRYDIGDRIVTMARGNRCKRGLPSIAEIVGRENELFVTRTGERFFPSIQARWVADYLDLIEVQFVQTDYEVVEIRYVPGNRGVPDRIDELRALVEGRLGHGIKMKLVPLTELPRPRGAKQIMKLSLVPRPPPR